MRSCCGFVWLFSVVVALQAAQVSGARGSKHPKYSESAARPKLDRLTTEVSSKIAEQGDSKPNPISRNNYIDGFVFGRMERDQIPHAPLASDTEFLRRAYLDLTGRIPEPEQIRKFLADADPKKRDKLIDELT